MGMPAAKIEPEPRVRTRVKVRPKAQQLTLPEEIRRALHGTVHESAEEMLAHLDALGSAGD